MIFIDREKEIQMYNSLGFVCVIVDNTGSNNRGLKFEGLLRNKMGTIEIDDQVCRRGEKGDSREGEKRVAEREKGRQKREKVRENFFSFCFFY